jgi:hypothetical protein
MVVVAIVVIVVVMTSTPLARRMAGLWRGGWLGHMAVKV